MGQLPFSECEPIRGYISASLDGELSEIEAARLHAHLESCAGCRLYAAELREVTRLLNESAAEELDFPIVLPSRRFAVARKLQVAAAAAGVAAVLGLSMVAGNGGGVQPNTPARGTSQGVALRFPEQELRMLHRASLRNESLAVHSSMTL